MTAFVHLAISRAGPFATLLVRGDAHQVRGSWWDAPRPFGFRHRRQIV